MNIAEIAQEEEWSSDSSEMDEELDLNEEGHFMSLYPLTMDQMELERRMLSHR